MRGVLILREALDELCIGSYVEDGAFYDFETIRSLPERGPMYFSCERFLMRRAPYAIYYRSTEKEVRIVAALPLSAPSSSVRRIVRSRR